jgi:hypothetical protein
LLSGLVAKFPDATVTNRWLDQIAELDLTRSYAPFYAQMLMQRISDSLDWPEGGRLAARVTEGRGHFFDEPKPLTDEQLIKLRDLANGFSERARNRLRERKFDVDVDVENWPYLFSAEGQRG